MHSGETTARHAWPGGHIVKGDERVALRALLKRQREPTSLQLAAAARLGLNPDGSDVTAAATVIILPAGAPQSTPSALKPFLPAHAATQMRRAGVGRVTFSEARVLGRAVPADAPLSYLFQTVQERDAARASVLYDDPSVAVLTLAMPRSRDEALRRARLLADELSSHASRFIHVGSSRPHAADGDASSARRVDRWAPAGSLRQLDVESDAVLSAEPLPRCNVPTRTDPEEPPPRRPDPPGPFTTAQLIPEDVVTRVEAHGRRVVDLLKRARRGARGAQVARGMRPEALILEEHEALNECGRGWTWRRRSDVDLWDAVQPSSSRDLWEGTQPGTRFAGKAFATDAERFGLLDKQVVSWGLHGFPGSRGMPTGRAVIGYPHAGAIKNAAALEEMNQRDIQNGFVTSGHSFPEIWPCVVDPMNIVIQHHKPRATIDKSMRLSSRAHPEPVLAYNDYIHLEEEREAVPFKLVRVWFLARASAILLTAGVGVKLGKFDLSTYFRLHGKQRAHVYQSGRLLETGYGFDWRVNFGERDAPDHTSRASDGLAFFVRTELRRLGAVYPTRCPRIAEWLAMRMGLAREADDADDPSFVWACLFFFLYYVDDAGLACFADLLFDDQGRPVTIRVQLADGSWHVRQQTRDELYFEASMGVVRRYGHSTPFKKQSPMDLTLDFLGIMLDIRRLLRLLTSDKRKAYMAAVRHVLDSATNPNGTIAADYVETNSLVHKLLHASEVVAIGRAHLFHLRAALRAAKRGAAGVTPPVVYLGALARRELEWWLSQLADEAACEQHGVPFAVRFGFPTSSPSTLVHYGDASRELDNLVESGFGAWSVIADIFVYIEGRWTKEELERFSINVLECVVKDMGTYRFYEFARSRGLVPTHSLGYSPVH